MRKSGTAPPRGLSSTISGSRLKKMTSSARSGIFSPAKRRRWSWTLSKSTSKKKKRLKKDLQWRPPVHFPPAADRAAVLAHDPLNDREPQPRPRLARRKKGSKDPAADFRAHAAAGVLDLDRDPLPCSPCAQQQLAAVGHRLEGVLDQVNKNLLEFARIAH